MSYYRSIPSPPKSGSGDGGGHPTTGTISNSKGYPHLSVGNQRSSTPNNMTFQDSRVSSLNTRAGDSGGESSRNVRDNSLLGAEGREGRETDEEMSDDDDGGETGEKSKVEIRREKNRVKQRNLRLRRANHISQLENTVSSLRADNASLAASIQSSHRREARLQAWLEAVQENLYRWDPSAVVECRQRFAEVESSNYTGPVAGPSTNRDGNQKRRRRDEGPRNPAGVDPLSTLAHAASAVQRPPPCSPTHPPTHISYPFNNGPSPFTRMGANTDNPYPTPDTPTPWEPHYPLWNPNGHPNNDPSAPRDNKRKWDHNPPSISPFPTHIPHHSSPRFAQPPPAHVYPYMENRRDGTLAVVPPMDTLPRRTSGSTTVSQGTGEPGWTTSGASGQEDKPEVPAVSPKSIRIEDLLSPQPMSSRLSSVGVLARKESWTWDIEASIAGGQVNGGIINSQSSVGDGGGTVAPHQPVPTSNRSSQGSTTLSSEYGLTPRSIRSTTGVGGVEVKVENGIVRVSPEVSKGEQPSVSAIFRWPVERPGGWEGFIGFPQSGVGGLGFSGVSIPFDLETGPALSVIPSPVRSTSILSTPLHSATISARSLLLSLFPSPLPNPLPSISDFTLSASQQLCLLVGLTTLSPPSTVPTFLSAQLLSLPPEDSATLLTYQSSPDSDPRLCLFPIAILRSKIVRALKNRLPFDLTAFITDVLGMVKIYGDPLDHNAWDLPDRFWDIWEAWFPKGREFCKSIREWRRRDGHCGSGVVEMILGIEQGLCRRVDPVGRPVGWKLG